MNGRKSNWQPVWADNEFGDALLCDARRCKRAVRDLPADLLCRVGFSECRPTVGKSGAQAVSRFLTVDDVTAGVSLLSAHSSAHKVDRCYSTRVGYWLLKTLRYWDVFRAEAIVEGLRSHGKIQERQRDNDAHRACYEWSRRWRGAAPWCLGLADRGVATRSNSWRSTGSVDEAQYDGEQKRQVAFGVLAL